MTEWFLQHVRLTAFSPLLKALRSEGSEALFEGLTGIEPEFDEKRLQGGFRRRAGVAGITRFELLEQLHRVDLTMQGPVDPLAAALEGRVSEAALGNISNIQEFVDAGWPLLDQCADITRLALGALLFIPYSSAEDAYAELSRKIDWTTARYPKTKDFMLQINYPTVVEIQGGIPLNRIFSWAVATARFDPALVIEPATSNEVWLQLTIDINTDVKNQVVLRQDDLQEIKNQFIRQAIGMSRGLFHD